MPNLQHPHLLLPPSGSHTNMRRGNSPPRVHHPYQLEGQDYHPPMDHPNYHPRSNMSRVLSYSSMSSLDPLMEHSSSNHHHRGPPQTAGYHHYDHRANGGNGRGSPVREAPFTSSRKARRTKGQDSTSKRENDNPHSSMPRVSSYSSMPSLDPMMEHSSYNHHRGPPQKAGYQHYDHRATEGNSRSCPVNEAPFPSSSNARKSPERPRLPKGIGRQRRSPVRNITSLVHETTETSTWKRVAAVFARRNKTRAAPPCPSPVPA